MDKLIWKVKQKIESESRKDRIEEIRRLLLSNREVEGENFLNPPRPRVEMVKDLADWDEEGLKKAEALIRKAIEEGRPILVYGDYDCDGVTSSAIMWEALSELGAKVWPFIPNRVEHGYGLSEGGIKEGVRRVEDKFGEKPLIVTVDNGISAHEEVKLIKELGMEVIVTDHHQVQGSKPEADSVVHTTGLAGSGVAWVLASTLVGREMGTELVALGSVCDLVDVKGMNRSLIKDGIEELRRTKSIGLKALMERAGVEMGKVGTYQIGFVIGPRINAAGRIGEGIEALRLLCTRDKNRAMELAEKLNSWNLERQEMTESSVENALVEVGKRKKLPKIILSASEEYHEGIVGLIASKLAERFNRPAIAMSLDEKIAKGSARSVGGVDITKIIGETKEMLLNYGGHEMAAGMSFERERLSEFVERMEKLGEGIDDELLIPVIEAEMELRPDDIDEELWEIMKQLEPFGPGNPKPLFLGEWKLLEANLVGSSGDHLRVRVGDEGKNWPGIGFGMGRLMKNLKLGEESKMGFYVDENEYRGKRNLQIVLKRLD